jgi:hypothetical protein
MAGNSSIEMLGGINLLGPNLLNGEALFEKTGSVKITKLSFFIKNDECPIHIK